MIPVYGFLQGDTLGILVFAYEEDTVETLASRLVSASCVRVEPGKNLTTVIFKGQKLDAKQTLKSIGLEPLERFDVVGGSDEL